MHGDGLQLALVFLLAAVVAVPLFKRFGLGAVLGYLAAGVVLGPFGDEGGRPTPSRCWHGQRDRGGDDAVRHRPGTVAGATDG